MQQLFWEIKKSGNYAEIVKELLSSYCALRCNMSLKYDFLLSHLDFFRDIWEPSLTSTVKGSIRIYPEWKKHTVANGTQTCWLTTAGLLYGRYQQKDIRDKRRQN
jgi:hypothetical protein